MSEKKKINTNNIPLLDNLVFYLKRLGTECIIKNEAVADAKESLQSVRKFDLYKMCMTGNIKYEFFDYSYDDLRKTSARVEDMYDILTDKNKASSRVKQELLELKKQETLNGYVELNNYYRMLNGLPDINDTDLIYISDGDLEEDDLVVIDPTVPIHEMEDDQQEFLNNTGIIDRYIEMYPDKKYLNYIGNRKIEPFTARTTPPFGLLYMPTNSIPVEVTSRWKDKYNTNRVFVMNTIYDREAFIDENPHYDNFIGMFIVLETMMDIISELPDFIIKRDIFDLGMIRLILKSYDVDYFPDIPLSFQQAIVRNINKLIEFKSTERGMVNICSIFGCENINIFKYYLFRARKTDENGKYVFNEKPEDNYELKFIKAPIEENVDDYIYNPDYQLRYADVTSGDKWWNGGLDYKYVSDTIKQHQFNYLQSKYYSIDCVFSMTEMLFEMVYFYNMIFDNVGAEDVLKVTLHNISNRRTFRLIDTFVFLFALSYAYYGLEDTIIFNTEDVLYIKGFDFDNNMSELADYICEITQGFYPNLEELGADGFTTFMNDEKVLSYNQLMETFLNNKYIYKHVVHQLTHANNKRMYDLYKTIYEALMIEELTTDFFQDYEGNVYESYSDYLKDHDKILYNTLNDIKNMDNDDRVQAASTMIDDIIYILDHEYFTDNNFEKIYSTFPTSDANSIIYYIKEMIDFFKSYKVQLDEINMIYLLDDEYENWVGAIDNVLMKIYLTPDTYSEDKDNIIKYIESIKNEYEAGNVSSEELHIMIEYWKDRGIFDEFINEEYLFNNTKTRPKEGHILWEKLKINQTYK